MHRIVLTNHLRQKASQTLMQKVFASSATAFTLKNHSEGVLPFSEIPKIPNMPFLGSTWNYLPLIGKWSFEKLHKANLQKYHKYGPISSEKFSRDFQFIQIFHPEDVAKIYQTEGPQPMRRQFMSFKKYRDSKRDLYNNGGLLTTNGQEWYEVRSQAQPHMMKPKAIHAFLDAMDQVAAEFTDRISHLRQRNGGEIKNLLSELNKWSLESVALVALDTRLGCIDLHPNQEAIKMIESVIGAMSLSFKLERSPLNLWRKLPSPTYRKFEKNMGYFSTTAFKYIQDARKRLENAPEGHEATFLEKMLSTTKDPRNLNAMLTDMMFAGVETTSNTVAFTLYHLARNPDVQQKVYEEIMTQLKGGPLTKEVINNMHYLKACIKESMRLNPVAIGSLRTTTTDLVLSGYAVPAGTITFIQMYVIGRLEKYFSDPEEYRPERFLREEAIHNPFAFLPFGHGTRSCIGRRIAEQEIWTVLIRLIQRFRVEYHFEDMDMNIRAVAVPDKPLRFQFYDR